MTKILDPENFVVQKKKTLLSHDQKKKNFAFPSVAQQSVAARKTNSGASFLSSNGHRNHQKRGRKHCDTEPGVTGFAGCRRGVKNTSPPTFPEKKYFCEKNVLQLDLCANDVCSATCSGKNRSFFPRHFCNFSKLFKLGPIFSPRTKKNPPLRPPYNPKKIFLCFCLRYFKTGGGPKIGLRSIFPQLKWTSEPSKTKRFAV
jgi:hypothetical protein